MTPLGFERLTARTMKTPIRIAIQIGSTYQCPNCKDYLALATEHIYWIDLEWWSGIKNLGLNWDDEQCSCRRCGFEVEKHIRVSDNWDQMYFFIKPPPEGGNPFV
jgi:hypothetical protein